MSYNFDVGADEVAGKSWYCTVSNIANLKLDLYSNSPTCHRRQVTCATEMDDHFRWTSLSVSQAQLCAFGIWCLRAFTRVIT